MADAAKPNAKPGASGGRRRAPGPAGLPPGVGAGPGPAALAAATPALAPDPAAAKPAKSPYRMVIGLRLSAVVEIVLFLAATVVIDHVFFDRTRFWAIEPHPFWVLVALVSVQYGTNEGVFAAVCCSVVLLSGKLPPQSIDRDFYAHVLMIGARPLLWLATAIVIGELRNRHARREAETEIKLREAEQREQGIALAYHELKAAHEKLEISVASELRSVVTIYRAAKYLQNLSLSEVITGAVDLVSTVLGPQKFSIYTLEGGSLRLALKRGWTLEDESVYDTLLWPDAPLFQSVIVGHRSLSISDPADEKVLGRQGVLAGPLFLGEGGEVLGMLKIERLRFADLNLTTIENFKIVCELLSNALGNAGRYDAATQQSIVSSDTMLLSDAFYARQASFLAALGRRIGFPVTIMRVSIADPEALSPSQRLALPGIVRDSATQVLRTTDLAFEFRSAPSQFVIVLPNTPMSATGVVIEKFERAVMAKLGAGAPRLTIACEPLVEAESVAAQPRVAIDEYARQTQFLVALSRRAGFPVSAVRIGVHLGVQLPAPLAAQLPAALLKALRESIEPSALAYSLERNGLLLAVLLPGYDLDGARRKAAEIQQTMAAKLGAAGGSIRISVQVEGLADGAVTPMDPRAQRPVAAAAPTPTPAAPVPPARAGDAVPSFVPSISRRR
jgi:polysaccharide biosynthesis protein PelD